MLREDISKVGNSVETSKLCVPRVLGLERQTADISRLIAGFINNSCCQPCPGLPMGSQASSPACSVHPLPFLAFTLLFHLLRLLPYISPQAQLDGNHSGSSHNASLCHVSSVSLWRMRGGRVAPGREVACNG